MNDHETRDGAGGRPDDGLLETVRALAEGRLEPDATAALLLRAAADPEDAALVAAFREVHAVTAVLDDRAAPEPPPCRVSFDDVEERIGARPTGVVHSWWGRAAAAVLLGAVALGAWTIGRPPATVTVRLTAVPLGHIADSDPRAGAALAAAAPLADYQPLRDGEPQWLASLDQGRAVARATGRPVLLFIHHPTCPMCLDLKGETFQDADVQARLAEFVPVMLNVLELPEALQPLLQRGWPYLGALNADGEELRAFPGASKPEPFAERLDEALADVGAHETVAGGRARALAARLRDAVSAGDSGDLVRECRELEALRVDDADGAFGGAAVARLGQRGTEVASALRRAAASPEVAEAALREVSERFRGTPWAADVAHVREALRETGRFPRLESRPDDGGDL